MKTNELLNEIWHIRFSCLPFSKEQGILTKGSLLKVLKNVHECRRDIYPFDHVPFYYRHYGHESFTSLLSHPREIQKREYISTPVNRVRGSWGSRAITKIVKTPGNDIRQKIGNAKNVDISKSVYTVNSLENEALVECVRKLLPLLKSREELNKYYRELKRLFRKSGLEFLPEMRTKQPNSKLIYDVHYRKIWKIYNWLIKVDKDKKKDEEHILSLTSEFLYLKILSKLVYKYNLIIPEHVVDFSKPLETSISLLSSVNEDIENVSFRILHKDNKIELKLNKYTENLVISEQNLLNDDFIDKLISRANIRHNNIYVFEQQKPHAFVIPYINVDKDSFYLSYFEEGFRLNPQYPFAVKDISIVEPISMINDSSKRSRLFPLKGITINTINLVADSLEPDNYYNLTSDQIPMSVALGLNHIEMLKESDSLTVLNYLSKPVTITKLTVKIDSQTNRKYFLRSVPEEFSEIKSVSDLLRKIAAELELYYSDDINCSIIEYLYKYNVLYLYNSKDKEWVKYTKPVKPDFSDIESDIVVNHPLFSKMNYFDGIKNGIEEYNYRTSNNIPVWKEEVIAFEMYLPDNTLKQIKKLTLVDENNTTIDPVKRKKQFISKDNLFFTIPGNKDKAIIPLLYNKESIRYAFIKLDPPLKKDCISSINLFFIYGEKEPYKLSFIDSETGKEYKADLLKKVSDLEKPGIPMCPVQKITLDEIKKDKSKLKFFSPNYSTDDKVDDFLDDIAEKETKMFNKKNVEQQNKDIKLCKLGECVHEDYWISLIDEADNYSNRAYKIRRRYAVAMSSEFRSFFIKRLLDGKSPNKFDDLWGLSYAIWYNQDVLTSYFSTDDSIDYLYKLIDMIKESFGYVKEKLDSGETISNFPSLLMLAILKLSESKSKVIRECISVSNYIMQELLFEMYNYDYDIRETRKKLNNKNKEILYSDGFNIEMEGIMDENINNMEKHNYLIHKYLIGDNPMISVDIKG